MDDTDDEDREFTPADRRKLRRMMEREERVEWLWSSLRVWGGWIGAAAAATYGVYQAFRESGVLKKFGGP